MTTAPETFGGQNLPFVESLYASWVEDPTSVEPAWRRYFQSFGPDRGARPVRLEPVVAPRSIFNPSDANGGDYARYDTSTAALQAEPRPAPAAGDAAEAVRAALLQDRVDQLVDAYRAYGHTLARLDPLERDHGPLPELQLSHFGLSERDLEAPCAQAPTVRALVEHLRCTYCRFVGVQFTHLDDQAAKEWLQHRMEATENRIDLTPAQQVRILTKLTDAEIFEQFIQKKFVGAKRFSLEGAESLIPLLDLAIEEAAEHGVEEVVIGMAHRGRLNVLANILGKSPRRIFREFEDRDPDRYWGRGDVKYHLGHYSTQQTASGRDVELTLCFNPSHLEFVSPVVLGRVRARQDRKDDEARTRVMPLILHGDAAFAGQGIVQETLNLTKLEGYATGGALHVIVNNQIGFTTDPEKARSTPYATDVARMLQAPIFHVNGEHPESVAQVIRLAVEFRARFRTDVFVDMYCYRRYGHNEGDEPEFTQPLMYQQIRRRKSVREAYLEHLMKPGGAIDRERADRIAQERAEYLEEELSHARAEDFLARFGRAARSQLTGPYVGGPERDVPDVPTAVPLAELQDLLRRQTELPEAFRVHKRLEKTVLAQRREMAEGQRPLDWGAAEAAAFATILVAGHPVRLTGQDVQRGTFSHRHAVLHDQEGRERPYLPLRHLGPGQARFEVWDSPLTEQAVLGYEWGYSLDTLPGLTVWEAQFGDFSNGAQVIIDQFLASAEDKWELLSGLALLLPHGFEGQGPEHSSARLERFLQLCAEDNLQVVNLTTPAQLFHCLRRQVLRTWRKPLVVMSPKSLLRHPKAVSPLSELAEGAFRRLIPDEREGPGVRRVLLVSGRLYYDLVEHREQTGRDDVAIVRVEQLYPFPDRALEGTLERCPAETPVVWVQEDPRNMGAWYFLRARFGETLWGRHPFSCVSREESASPATGSTASHKQEQALLLRQAFGEVR